MHVKEESDPVYVPVEKSPEDVVVAPYEVLKPYTKPRAVGLIFPTEVIVPFPVAVVAVIEEAACVVTVGELTDIVVVESIEPYPVPPEFVEYARK